MKYLFLLPLFLTLSAGTIRGQGGSTPQDTAARSATGSLPSVKCMDDVILYPNPAGNELNVIYDPLADVRNITVYNLIGKVVGIYKVTGNNSANLNLDSIAPGIYFVRLFNSQGELVLAKKFTRQ